MQRGRQLAAACAATMFALCACGCQATAPTTPPAGLLEHLQHPCFTVAAQERPSLWERFACLIYGPEPEPPGWRFTRAPTIQPPQPPVEQSRKPLKLRQ